MSATGSNMPLNQSTYSLLETAHRAKLFILCYTIH